MLFDSEKLSSERLTNLFRKTNIIILVYIIIFLKAFGIILEAMKKRSTTREEGIFPEPTEELAAPEDGTYLLDIIFYCNYFYVLDTLASKAAARAKRLLGTDVIGKGEQVAESHDLKRTCIIISFGDYEAEL